jgi:hypothetical protein
VTAFGRKPPLGIDAVAIIAVIENACTGPLRPESNTESDRDGRLATQLSMAAQSASAAGYAAVLLAPAILLSLHSAP